MSSQPRTVFFTHNWGEGNENHNHCRDIAQFLKNEGIPLWFDEKQVEGKVADAAIKAIDEPDVFLIAVTPTYMAKINKGDVKFKFLGEFNYAMGQARFADNVVCIVTDEDALDTNLWKGTFKTKVGNPVAINLCPSLTGEERGKNLRELAALLKRKLAQSRESQGGNNGTSLTIERLTILLDLIEVPEPHEVASVLIASGNDSLKKLSALEVDDLCELKITTKNSKIIFDGIIAKLRRVESYEAELEAANEAKTIMFWMLTARNAQEAAAGCAAIKRFLANSKNDPRALFDLGCSEAVVTALQRYAADARVAEQACAAIGSIPKDFAAEHKKFGEMGGCEVVVATPQRFGAENAQVAEQGCRAIINLAYDHANNNRKLGEIGACEAVVAALKRFGAENAQVVEDGCGAIRNLAYDDANKQKLGEIGGCDAVVVALKCFGAEHVKVADYGCNAIGSLVNNNNREKLGQLGACEAVVAALRRFGAKNAEAAKQGYWAIMNLAVDDVNKLKRGEQGVRETGDGVLKLFGVEDAGAAEQMCRAVESLAVNGANTQKLGESGAYEAVVAALKRFGGGTQKW